MKNITPLLLTFSILFITLWSNGQNTITTSSKYEKNTTDSLIKIFDANSKITHYDLSEYSRYTPTIEEYDSVKDIIKNYVINHSKDKTPDHKAITNYDDYYKQIYGLIDAKGNKILFINCFMNPLGQLHFYWRDETVRVKGGGRDYFNLKINLSNKTVYDFNVNSPK